MEDNKPTIIYKDENFSINKNGYVVVYGTAEFRDLLETYNKFFLDKMKITDEGDSILRFNV